MANKIESAIIYFIHAYLMLFIFLYVTLPVSSQGFNQFSNSIKNEAKNGSNSENQIPSTPKPPQEVEEKEESRNPATDILYIILITVLSVIGVTAVVAAGFCWYRHKHVLIATERVLYRSSDSSVLIHNGGQQGHQEQSNGVPGAHHLTALAKRTEYPAYGVTGPNPLHEQPYETPVDGVLNKEAEVYHYNQTKKRMKALSSSATSESSSTQPIDPQDVTAELEVNDEETSDGEYTVYECSGFAAAMDGPMEIHNPLFDDMLDESKAEEFSYQDMNGYHQNPSFVSTSSK